MNGNHLPAGQPMPGGGIGGATPGQGLNGGRRRPPTYPNQNHPVYQHHIQHHQHASMMYGHSYMNPYANVFYSPTQMGHHYQTGHMHNPHHAAPYTAYPPQRSPPPLHQTYPPIVSSTMQPHPQPWARPPRQPSPVPSTPPPPPPPVPPPYSNGASQPASTTETLSSNHSPKTAASLSSATTEAQVVVPSPLENDDLPQPTPEKHAIIQLPWLSVPDEPFPRSAANAKRRRRKLGNTESVELPLNKQNGDNYDDVAKPSTSDSPETQEKDDGHIVASAAEQSLEPTVDRTSLENYVQSGSPAEQSSKDGLSTIPTLTKTKATPRAAVPAVPVIRTVAKATHTEPPAVPVEVEKTLATVAPTTTTTLPGTSQTIGDPESIAEVAQVGPEVSAPAVKSAQGAPQLWSKLLFKNTTQNKDTASPAYPTTDKPSPGDSSALATDTDDTAIGGPGGFSKSNTSSLADALRNYHVSHDHKVAFLEPRGLVNTGNMCYMNSVLQALIFCAPFYNFLDQVNKKSAHSFNSPTPLIDAMVMLLREYKVIDSATSVDQLRKRLKSKELEQYGDAFTPEFVYEAIKRLPRFASMQRGHQQDAEEFLGFLLQALGDECSLVMRQLEESSAAIESSEAPSTGASSPTGVSNGNEWLEVGRKQRAAVTRSSGHATSSPISKVFSGQIRSVLRIPGQKDSVTFETYQSLQLDIGDAHVNNIVDALKYYTRPEKLIGDFGSTRTDTKTTKQVLIESTPPVLILHLKRFQYDAKDNSTSKLWTKVDYPLELELPKEIFSPSTRSALLNEGIGFPKYRLTSAIYHHGKSASGGHYTVDLRRQDNQEWIRVDDTIIRRIRSEDVAASGVEGTTANVITKVDQKSSAIGPVSGNRFEGMNDEDGGDEEGWSKVSASGASTKKWSSVASANNSGNPASAKNTSVKESIKDNKVAYLLFYQKI